MENPDPPIKRWGELEPQKTDKKEINSDEKDGTKPKMINKIFGK